MQIVLKTNFPAVTEGLKQLSDEIGTRALISTMNKAAAQGRTAMVKQITSEFAIKAADVRAQLFVMKARFAKSALNAVVTLEAFGRRRGHRSRNVMLFGAKQKIGRKTKRVRFPTARGWITKDVPVGGGVTVLIRRGAGRKLIRGAFIGNEGRTVFIRKAGQRRAIEAVETIDIPQMFNTQRVNHVVVRLIEASFPRIFEQEARYFVTRYSA